MRAASSVVGALLLALGSLGGCYPTSNICGEREQELSAPDGGAQRCVRAEDCQRPDGLRVCVSTGVPEAPCVRCTDTRCTRHDPEPCQ